MTTTTTVSVQRQCAEALVRILEIPDLAEATWYVHPRDHGGELAGQLRGSRTLNEARAAVSAYAFELGLTAEPDRFTPGDDKCPSFVDVSAKGTYMGATVHVWTAADQGATS